LKFEETQKRQFMNVGQEGQAGNVMFVQENNARLITINLGEKNEKGKPV